MSFSACRSKRRNRFDRKDLVLCLLELNMENTAENEKIVSENVVVSWPRWKYLLQLSCEKEKIVFPLPLRKKKFVSLCSFRCSAQKFILLSNCQDCLNWRCAVIAMAAKMLLFSDKTRADFGGIFSCILTTCRPAMEWSNQGSAIRLHGNPSKLAFDPTKWV